MFGLDYQGQTSSNCPQFDLDMRNWPLLWKGGINRYCLKKTIGQSTSCSRSCSGQQTGTWKNTAGNWLKEIGSWREGADIPMVVRILHVGRRWGLRYFADMIWFGKMLHTLGKIRGERDKQFKALFWSWVPFFILGLQTWSLYNWSTYLAGFQSSAQDIIHHAFIRKGHKCFLFFSISGPCHCWCLVHNCTLWMWLTNFNPDWKQPMQDIQLWLCMLGRLYNP